ncbi:MAG: hypothetical protein CO150_02835 [Nitrospirae bacterium CG_4_9_14_3_um_filter_53_35]|nr:MAG: hypothetical protein AUK29_04600 [Nitrospirae bacterium CG2_30_53_67]PIS38110.1 MAG: hypothetical protein COT35_02885 [Nitrospirae bacterium CG08_land_8_20_14_0_20_52_24]PIV83226.1 MAG: hypothetical protein COW52_09360 [Nitrospirae bacterium CG17_big_fil_post_rev_8_21_14_2_50_50_9]PIW86086.1 MAG: hypothetical protein COZ95_01155 [Nitrospirae bacterium CG_4_8_14_3_um_filter_50_41]PIX86975.1 MAG: hypothetical protein COZ32_00315 [Nitrospirae bacterium CG_4_10_14_3_um_filter_53_41]PJA7663
MKRTVFLISFVLILLQNDMLGARYSNGGVELVKFMALENEFCRTQIYHEYNKYDEINKYLEVSFKVYPSFIEKRVGLRLKDDQFKSGRRELEIQIISDQTMNSRVIGRYGLLLPVDGLYDSESKTIYITRDYDIKTLVHEYFHFLRDASGIAMDHDEEEKLADDFSDLICDAVDPDGRTLVASPRSVS